MKELYIGLMSGTSIDSVDAIIADIGTNKITSIAQKNFDIPKELRIKTLELILQSNNPSDFLSLDNDFVDLFSESVLKLLNESKISFEEIKAIGSHGQTVLHQPNRNNPFSLQLGDPKLIAKKTQIRTVGCFRQRDIENGGQGAPLSPLFHEAFFNSDKKTKGILNLGGIANISIIGDLKGHIIGYDSGPGNCLMDSWIRKNKNKDFDNEGAWAKKGTVNNLLLQNLLKDPFFSEPAPKSTGPDYFNLDWLEKKLNSSGVSVSEEDIQATLLELTFLTVSESFSENLKENDPVYICGGGLKNKFLIEKIKKSRKGKVSDTGELKINPDYLEAIGFAWLAKQRISKKSFDLSRITGSQEMIMLGEVFNP